MILRFLRGSIKALFGDKLKDLQDRTLPRVHNPHPLITSDVYLWKEVEFFFQCRELYAGSADSSKTRFLQTCRWSECDGRENMCHKNGLSCQVSIVFYGHLICANWLGLLARNMYSVTVHVERVCTKKKMVVQLFRWPSILGYIYRSSLSSFLQQGSLSSSVLSATMLHYIVA